VDNGAYTGRWATPTRPRGQAAPDTLKTPDRPSAGRGFEPRAWALSDPAGRAGVCEAVVASFLCQVQTIQRAAGRSAVAAAAYRAGVVAD